MALKTLSQEKDAVRAERSGSRAHVSGSARNRGWGCHMRGLSLPLPPRGRSATQGRAPRGLSCFIPPWAPLAFALSGQGGDVPGIWEHVSVSVRRAHGHDSLTQHPLP